MVFPLYINKNYVKEGFHDFPVFGAQFLEV